MSNTIKTAELFKQTIPQIPDGYYSGDKPNPNLRAFAEQNLKANPYEPANDDYDVPLFDKAIDTTKTTAIYNMHTYWSKKPHDAIREYIQHHTQPGDLILDPFSGSGSTALAALIDGRKVIAIDRSPAATFITKNYCAPVLAAELLAAFGEVRDKLRKEIEWLYETRCHLTDTKAHTDQVVYSQVFECPKCLKHVVLFDCVQIASQTAKGKPKTILVCPHCHPTTNEQIDVGGTKFGAIPVLVCYSYTNAKGRKAHAERRYNDKDSKAREYFEKYDIAKIREIEQKTIPYWFPTNTMMNAEDKRWGLLWRPYHGNIRRVSDFFTPRNTWAIGAYLSAVEDLSCTQDIRDALKGVLTGVLHGFSKMNRYRPDVSFPLNYSANTLYVPPIGTEEAIWHHLENKLKKFVNGYTDIANQINTNRDILISTEDARHLAAIPDESIDYVFTDPPYGYRIQYAEMNFIIESWLRLDTRWQQDEIIVNSTRSFSEETWGQRMRDSLKEMFRVLKPHRWISLCFHADPLTWEILQNAAKEAGFEKSQGSAYIDTGSTTHKQAVAEDIPMRDLVVNFRKPRRGESTRTPLFTGKENQTTFREKAHSVIREFLTANPGSPKNRVYDALVSQLLSRGQMQAHNFDELLREVADEIKEPARRNLFENEEPDLLGSHQVSRWYLKETQAGADESEQASADAAGAAIHDFLTQTTAAKLKSTANQIDTLDAAIATKRQRLQEIDQGKADEPRGRILKEIRELTTTLEKLTAERAECQQQALRYSDISEFFLTFSPKPKSTIDELLEDYCYKTDEGNWRPPLTEPEKKEKGNERQRAVRRKIQRFCNLLEAGQAVPDQQRPDTATLAEWIRHCRRTGLHAQGKLLYERGGLSLDQLNEEDQVNVEEDYQVCVRSLSKQATPKKSLP